jgi:hypothetical protein
MEMTKITPLSEGNIKNQMKKKTNHFNCLMKKILVETSFGIIFGMV